MIDQLVYYLQLFAELCGFNRSDGYDLPGWIAVCLALAVVIFAFYEAISKALWPGENDVSHIKYKILEEHEGKTPRAH